MRHPPVEGPRDHGNSKTHVARRPLAGLQKKRTQFYCTVKDSIPNHNNGCVCVWAGGGWGAYAKAHTHTQVGVFIVIVQEESYPLPDGLESSWAAR